MTVELVDAAGRRRSPATLPGYLAGRSLRNKGVRYPADPPSVEEIVAVMRSAWRLFRFAGETRSGRLPGWREFELMKVVHIKVLATEFEAACDYDRSALKFRHRLLASA